MIEPEAGELFPDPGQIGSDDPTFEAFQFMAARAVGLPDEFRAVDAETGARLWSTDRLTPHERWANSYLVRNGDRWFAISETGELVIARFNPAGYEEIDRTLLLEPTTRTRGGASGRWDDRAVLWAHPAFANQHVVARNDVEVVRLSLAAEDYQ